MTDLVATKPGPGVRLSVTPESAGWKYLSFSVVALAAGDSHRALETDRETAIVPLSGSGTVIAGSDRFSIARTSVFTQMPSVAYVPPGVEITVESDADFEFAIGSAPAAWINSSSAALYRNPFEEAPTDRQELMG